MVADEWNLTTTDEDLPEDVVAVYLPGSSSHFGVPALLGRRLIPSDAPMGQDPQPVVVLGYKFWQRHYNAIRRARPHAAAGSQELHHRGSGAAALYLGRRRRLPAVLKVQDPASGYVYPALGRESPARRPTRNCSRCWSSSRHGAGPRFPPSSGCAARPERMLGSDLGHTLFLLLGGGGAAAGRSAAPTSRFCCWRAAPPGSTNWRFAPPWAPAAGASCASC